VAFKIQNSMKQKILKRMRSLLTLNRAQTRPSNYQNVFIHPCVINNQPHIVYPRGLKQQSPEFFNKLSQHFCSLGYYLKEDRRSDSGDKSRKNERRHWVPALLFTTSLLFESSANADVEVEINSQTMKQQQKIELQIVPNRQVRLQIRQQIKPLPTKHTSIKSDLARFIFNLLTQHYINQDTDPKYIIDDFKQIANYYSGFPEVVALFQALNKKNWQLSYDEDNWVTVGSGNIFQVDKAVIHFNTRSAAQLRLNNSCKQNPVCIASPADALLHELLHTHSMLNNTEEFIAQGGMNNVMYPYKHEYTIIKAERELYIRMSKQDKVKRPYRNEHTGRIVKARCPTCIK